MSDVPAVVGYGQVIGHFVRFIADTADAGSVPDETTLTGSVTLTPLTTFIRWPTSSPPRLAVADAAICPVVNGDLCAPGSTTPGVFVIATAQPEGQPTLVQWRAVFKFDGVATQPTAVVFDVPNGGIVDLSQAVSVTPEPPVITVVSTELAEQAAASAAAAAQSAQDAADYAASGNPGPPGNPGNPGTPATVSVGMVTTLAAGSNATVTDTDPAASNAVLDFGIPQGAKGNKGDQGIAGVIVLSAAAPIPGGTPAGTIVLRTAT